MAEVRLRCPKCGAEYEAGVSTYRCRRCGEPLLVKSEGAFLSREFTSLTLGEGSTPTVRRGRIFFKLECLNPSGSFKDRGAASAVSFLLGKGVSTIIEDSSGNAGIAFSCYGAAAGLKVRVYVPSDVPEGKYAIMRGFGAEVIRAGSRDDAHFAAINDHEGVYVGHTVNPYFIEGVKLIAAELLSDLGKEVLAESTIFAPIASGTLLLGLWKGFKEMLEAGTIDSLPKVVGVQACGYDYLSRSSELKVTRLACTEKTKFADALRLTKGERAKQNLLALKELGGELVVVGDPVAIDGFRELVKSGLLIEPTSSLAYVAAKHYLQEGLANYAVVPLTGSGLKYLPADKRLWSILGV